MARRFVLAAMLVSLLVSLPAGATAGPDALAVNARKLAALDDAYNAALVRLHASDERAAELDREVRLLRALAVKTAVAAYMRAGTHVVIDLMPAANRSAAYADALDRHDATLVHRLAAATRSQRHEHAVELERARTVDHTRHEIAAVNARLIAEAQAHAQAHGAEPTITAPDVPASSAAAATAVAYAKAQLGKPYVYAATGPNSFDCSGLTLMAWRAAGVELPRTSQQQALAFPRVPVDQLAPGDLLVYYPEHSHIAIYIGAGLQIAAPHTGLNVQVQRMSSSFQFAVRP